VTYASKAEIEDRFGDEALLFAADRDADGALDLEAVEKAIADSSAEIDTYVSQRYSVPLSTVPEILVKLGCTMAMYELRFSHDVLTDEWRRRYEDAIALLKRIADGSVNLGLAVPATGSKTIEITANTRRMTRDNLGVL